MLLDLLFELFLFPAYLLSGILGYFIPLNSLSVGGNKGPLVFVHGWMTQNPIFFFFKKFMENKGFTVYMTNFGWELGDIEQSAQMLKNYIESRNLKNIILVGASEGGIIALTYLQLFDGWQNIKKFVAIASPFKGAYLAVLAPFSKAAVQMKNETQFLKKILGKGIPPLNKVVCISAKYDEIVSPSSSFLPGAQREVVNCFGHISLQTISPEVHKLIAKIAIT